MTTNDLCSFLWTCDFKVNTQQVRQSMLATTDTNHCKVKATHTHTQQRKCNSCFILFRSVLMLAWVPCHKKWHSNIAKYSTYRKYWLMTLQSNQLPSPNIAPATKSDSPTSQYHINITKYCPCHRGALLCSTRLDSTLLCFTLLSLFKSPQTWKFLNSTSFDINIYQYFFILFHILAVCVYVYLYIWLYMCIHQHGCKCPLWNRWNDSVFGVASAAVLLSRLQVCSPAVPSKLSYVNLLRGQF